MSLSKLSLRVRRHTTDRRSKLQTLKLVTKICETEQYGCFDRADLGLMLAAGGLQQSADYVSASLEDAMDALPASQVNDKYFKDFSRTVCCCLQR